MEDVQLVVIIHVLNVQEPNTFNAFLKIQQIRMKHALKQEFMMKVHKNAFALQVLMKITNIMMME